MEKLQFTIVALPENGTLKILNELRNYFYNNGFRFYNKPNTSDAHISLAEGSCNENEVQTLRRTISDSLKEYSPIKAQYSEVTSVKRGPIPGKCDFDNSWVSILFNNTELQKLSMDVDSVLKIQNMSTTGEYISRIAEEIHNGDIQRSQVIANHVNICNYCRPERSTEARDLIISKIGEDITFDRVALRYKNGQHAWEIEL